MSIEHVDVLIIGAGVSGINAAYRLQTQCPDKSYRILEERSAMGGTWDLFRYPGIRSDSPLITFGFSFNPWKDSRAISSGNSIAAYIEGTAVKFGIDRHIRFGHHVVSADFCTDTSLWTLQLLVGPDRIPRTITCNFLSMCTGYYDRRQGYLPDFPGLDEFTGDLVHPQHWPQNYDHTGKRVVIIGSGATAVSLVPAMAADAEHVTMLQRSPGYYSARTDIDPMIGRLFRWLPERVAGTVLRSRSIVRGSLIYRLCQTFPNAARRSLQKDVAGKLGDRTLMDRHFTPRYNPWDQRLCFVPNGDMFEAINAGKASVVTDTIETFTATGVRLASGAELEADLIVTATGLTLQAFGGIPVAVDGEAVDPGSSVLYRGSLLGNVPNLSVCLGYSNASWTLGSDIAAKYMCRVINHMDEHDFTQATPRFDDSAVQTRPLLDLTSGYVTRGPAVLPKQGTSGPWVRQPYIRGSMIGRFGRIDDSMEFTGTRTSTEPARAS